MQEPVRERPAPLTSHHFRTDNDVAELARKSFRQLAQPVDWEREHVGYLVDRQMLALERADLLARHEAEPELALLDALPFEHRPGERDDRLFVDRGAASVVDLDLDHRRRSA